MNINSLSVFQVTKMKTVKQWLKAEQEEESTKIEVFPYSRDPTFAWAELRVRTIGLKSNKHV